MESKLMYLNTYVIQQDMRIRLPKSILTNLEIEKGKSKFDIFLDTESNNLILKIHKEKKMEE